MCRFLVFIFALSCCLEPLFGGVDPQVQQSVVAAAERSNLLDGNGASWQLELDFEARLAVPTDRGPAFVPTSGHLTLKWAGKNRWWRKSTMGSFEQTDIRNGEMLYTSRNLAVTPLRLDDVFDLLQGLPVKGLRVRKEKIRTEQGESLACFQVDYEHKGNDIQARRNICLDTKSQDVVSVEYEPGGNERRLTKFADYIDFQGYRVPRRLEFFLDGTKVVVATVASLSPTTIEDSAFVPPKDAIARRQCENMKYPRVTYSPDPIPSEDVARQQLNNELVVAITVLTDGTVGDLRVVGASHTQALSESMIRALKSWKFKPAMCGSEPVVSDIHVEVHTTF